jgi:hypothetical protein
MPKFVEVQVGYGVLASFMVEISLLLRNISGLLTRTAIVFGCKETKLGED